MSDLLTLAQLNSGVYRSGLYRRNDQIECIRELLPDGRDDESEGISPPLSLSLSQIQKTEMYSIGVRATVNPFTQVRARMTTVHLE